MKVAPALSYLSDGIAALDRRELYLLNTTHHIHKALAPQIRPLGPHYPGAWSGAPPFLASSMYLTAQTTRAIGITQLKIVSARWVSIAPAAT